MSKTILIAGYGPGISNAVAEKFGAEGFRVALVARNRERLEAGVAALRAKGVEARAFPADLADPTAAAAVVASVGADLGPLTALLWNAYPSGPGDVTVASVAEVRSALDLGVTSLLAAVQAALPDLRKAKDAGLLITGGGFAFYDAKVDAAAVAWSSMGLATVKAAQHKLAGLLTAKLAPEGIHVSEVVVTGMVKGTAFDTGDNATLEPATVANAFWKLHTGRTDSTVVL